MAFWKRSVCLAVMIGLAVIGSTAVAVPLSDLPSAEGGHVAQIRALASNSWLSLGSPAPDPIWGRARGRAWSPPMPLAPELRGAFLFGEGPHGEMFQGNYYGDEMFFYDINANAWVCVWPGADVTKYGEVVIDANGFETRGGWPVPIASMVHAYEMVTYDTTRRCFMSMPCPGIYWKDKMPDRNTWLQSHPLNETYASPWMYDVAGGHWNRLKTTTARPASSFGEIFIYSAASDKCFYWSKNKGLRHYSPATNAWSTPTASGPTPPNGSEPVACLDTRRNRVYIGGGIYPTAPAGSNALWIYDISTKTWIDPKPAGVPPCNGDNAWGAQTSLMHYDSVNDVVLLIRHNGEAAYLGVFAYDPNTNTWSTVTTSLPADMLTRGVWSGFYDPQLNAHFVFAAKDGSVTGNLMYVYRYKPLAGDIDGDGHVDMVDLQYLADAWAATVGNANYDQRCDFNNDGNVNVVDLLMMASNWGR